MQVLISLVILTLIVIIVCEAASRFAFGKVLKESDLVAFFAKHFEDYSINDISWKRGARVFYGGEYPYIAKGCGSLFFSWYIHGHGRILRTSKFSKILDARFAELVQELPSSTKLKDL